MSLAALTGVLHRVPGNTAGNNVDRSMMMLEMSKHKSAKTFFSSSTKSTSLKLFPTAEKKLLFVPRYL